MAASESADQLDAAGMERALSTRLIGRRILVLSSTTSTNDAVFQMAGEGAEEGLVIFADEQTAGRGQRGHHWESAARLGLWFSILLKPALSPAQSTRLTAWAARAVAATITRELSLPAAIKPPNDIYMQEKKAGGVLVEMRAQPGRPHLVIAGIGLNLLQKQGDFSASLHDTAISLSQAAQRSVPRQAFALALLRELDRTYCALFAT